MKKLITPILIVLTITFLTSCTGYRMQVSSEPLGTAQKYKKREIAKDWKKIPIYEVQPDTAYIRIAEIKLLEGYSTSDRQFFNKLKKEARYYNADAIVLKEEAEVIRKTFDGVTLFLNLVSAFNLIFDFGEVRGEYVTYESKAFAIRYLGK